MVLERRDTVYILVSVLYCGKQNLLLQQLPAVPALLWMRLRQQRHTARRRAQPRLGLVFCTTIVQIQGFFLQKFYSDTVFYNCGLPFYYRKSFFLPCVLSFVLTVGASRRLQIKIRKKRIFKVPQSKSKFWYPGCALTAEKFWRHHWPTEGFPWDDLRKILPGDQRVAKLLNGVETLPKISTG